WGSGLQVPRLRTEWAVCWGQFKPKDCRHELRARLIRFMRWPEMPTRSRTRVWEGHVQDRVLYSLKHLHPKFVSFHAPARAAQPGHPGRVARDFIVRVEYSHHCFSNDAAKVPNYNPDHLYIWEKRKDDLRVFCPKRYEDSKELPELIGALDQRNVYPTRHHNHFAVKRVTPDGHYSIWFRVERANRFLLMVVESAYVRLDMDEQIARSSPTKLIDVLVNAK
ncbi:hypothetical protein, partial [Xanthomonas phaseoli]